MTRREPTKRELYPHFLQLQTRWMDNDVYGHVNNVIYYSYFDTVVNEYLISSGVLDISGGEVIGLVAHTECDYFAPLSFPQKVDAGLRVERLGGSSVTYEIGLFDPGSDEAVAVGSFVHVYVDRETRRSTGLPAPLREALERLTTGGTG
ncbi:acyl-CoA thioesterase [Rubrobacter aplysinae]|uniref:acyl-CoA thioesterase n=1 Tax=Rubrobacter aplysinae TaxID=909625 RepID=UPI00064C45CC|nr:thioesterase family protein [Rubrobacter aplysinae]